MMAKNFNDLFNHFFGENSGKADKNKFNEEMKRLINSIESSMKNINDNPILDKFEEDLTKEIGDVSKKPDKIEFFDDGDLYYQKHIWKTKNGIITKIFVSDIPFDAVIINESEEKTLEEQLEEAVKNEEYEKAANLRDEIKKKNKPKRKSKKNI